MRPSRGGSAEDDASRPDDLPYVDTHEVQVRAGPASVWAALLHFANNDVGIAPSNPLARLLGTQPATGFEVVGADSGRWLALAGRHRFARYQLVFHVTGKGERETTLSGHTYSAFPGLPGRAYRAVVVGTGIHAVATTRMLRAVAAMAERQPDPP